MKRKERWKSGWYQFSSDLDRALGQGIFLAAVLVAYGLWYLLLLFPLGGLLLFCVYHRPAARRQQAPIAPELEVEMDALDCSQEITFRQYLGILRTGSVASGDGLPQSACKQQHQPEISDCSDCGYAMTVTQKDRCFHTRQ